MYVKETLKASRGFDFLSFVVARMDGGYGKTCFVALAASWMQVGCKLDARTACIVHYMNGAFFRLFQVTFQ